MSVAVCRGPAVPAFETPAWLRPAELYKPEAAVADDRPAQVDVWNAIQADVVDSKAAAAKKPYVSPRVRRSMSQKSLEVCTESLGCETGSGDFTDAVDMACLFGASPLPTAPGEAEESFWEESSAAQESCYPGEVDLVAVNYHSSAGRRSPRRSFPPPLPSMSSRDGPCLKMCSRRQDGRLVVEAVVVRPRGYLQANRQGGRLCLSFIECSARGQRGTSKSAAPAEASYFVPVMEGKCEPEQEVAMQVEEEEEEEDEEEVEVVDRGTMVEVKVSSQPQAPAAAKVHRSTLVINKFVGSTPFTLEQARCHAADAPHPEPSAREETPTLLRRVPSSTTTLAAAVAVASTETGAPHAPVDGDDSDEEDEVDECGGRHHRASALAAADTKQQLLLFTSRRGDKHDLLQSVRRCRQLRQKPLFILEQYCIATS
ncbi:protein FAF-like, chloroplastic [Triticum dicoccoides]|uniref:protein FAF-like, chloroplastic n=1 Tax=Triticum dicoccoides TaxID=85692 RepID=UPI000E7CD3C5|nr:protein FAF-like, chloroplastic [Triticum dicoccoides]